MVKAVLLADVNLARPCLERCIIDILEWCAQRRLQLNPGRTEVIWFGRCAIDRPQAMKITIRVGQLDIEPVDYVRHLCVLPDSSLSTSPE